MRSTPSPIAASRLPAIAPAKAGQSAADFGAMPFVGRRAGLLATFLLLAANTLLAGPGITNVSVVNVTPTSFSAVWQTAPGSTPSIAVFADPGGATNLSGLVGVEYFPLHTGSPTASNAYAKRMSQATLRQRTTGLGLAEVRISSCQPHTTYYFQLQEADNQGGLTLWPSSGPLPSVTTAADVDFVPQSRQLVFNLPGLDPSGAIVVLSNSNTPSLLAAVAGDGIGSNQVFFSLSDVLDASGYTNYLPIGSQTFTATVLGAATGESQAFTVNFTADFLVGQVALSDLSQFAVLTLGSPVVPVGATGSVPIGVYASGITNLTFALNLPTNRFQNLALQALSPQVGTATLHFAGSNTLVATLSAAPGQTLEGDQKLAQLNFVATSNQPPAYLPLIPFAFQAANEDGSAVSNLAAAPGSLILVALQPFLRDSIAADGTRSLSLYGLPGYSYGIQQSTDLHHWSDLLRVPMTNLVQVLSGLNPANARVFYRAYEFMADPPLIEANPALSQTGSLLIYGRPGTNYTVQFATNLSPVVTWHPLLTTTLTNSFQFLSNIPAANPSVFYRLKR